MTPLQFARKECANFNKDGSCRGVKPEDLVDTNGPWWNRKETKVKFLNKESQCALAKAGERCCYFEQVILPLADHPSPKDEPGLQSKRQKARESYLARTGQDSPEKVKQNSCECGAVIPKRRRYCDKCAAKKRRETRRISQNKWRAK